MNKETVLCIQARMGSSRFRGKMLAPLGGLPLLAWLALRLQRCRQVNRWFLATSVQPENDPLVELAQTLGLETYRGDEIDVLKRFGDVIRLTDCQHIVRVCGDNPLIDPEEVDRVIAYHKQHNADYSFNHIPAKNNGYPDGLGAEVFCSGILLEAEAKASIQSEREHINQWVLHRTGQYCIGAVAAPEAIAAPDVRLDVDTPADLDYIRQVLATGKLNILSTATDIISAARMAGPHPQRISA